MLAMSPGSWGAAESAALPDWMPAVSAVFFAVCSLAIGILTLRGVWERTSSGYAVFAFQLFFGAWLMLVCGLVLLVLATRIAEPSTYESLLDENGRPNVTPEGFAFINLWVTIFVAIFVAFCAYLYCEAITYRAKRVERPPDEVDGVGEMLRRTRA